MAAADSRSARERGRGGVPPATGAGVGAGTTAEPGAGAWAAALYGTLPRAMVGWAVVGAATDETSGVGEVILPVNAGGGWRTSALRRMRMDLRMYSS